MHKLDDRLFSVETDRQGQTRIRQTVLTLKQTYLPQVSYVYSLISIKTSVFRIFAFGTELFARSGHFSNHAGPGGTPSIVDTVRMQRKIFNNRVNYRGRPLLLRSLIVRSTTLFPSLHIPFPRWSRTHGERERERGPAATAPRITRRPAYRFFLRQCHRPSRFLHTHPRRSPPVASDE